MFCHWLRTRKWSVIAVCSGAVAGMVCATPAAGYIGIHACLALGVLSGVICWASTFLNKLLSIDDTFMAFACHGVGGFLGMLLTGIFADSTIIRLDGTCVDRSPIPLCQPGGWVDHVWVQLPIQLAGATAAAIWSFGWSYIIIKALRWTSIITLKEEHEDGLDLKVLGEPGYGFLRQRASDPGNPPVSPRPSDTGVPPRTEGQPSTGTVVVEVSPK